MGLVVARKGLLDLVAFLADLRQHQPRVVPVKADLRRLVLQFDGAGRAGRATGTSARKPARAWSGRPAARRFTAFSAFSCALISAQTPSTASGVRCFRFAEHMGMAANHLFVDRLDHGAEIEQAALLAPCGRETPPEAADRPVRRRDRQNPRARWRRPPRRPLRSHRARCERKSCARSQAQPISGVRRRAMISSRREMSREAAWRPDKCGRWRPQTKRAWRSAALLLGKSLETRRIRRARWRPLRGPSACRPPSW